MAHDDPTARRQAALLENADLFRALLDQSRDAIFITDPESGRFLYVNAEACASLGYAQAELLALRAQDIEDTLSPAEAWDEHLLALRSEAAITQEGTHRRKDGSRFPVEVSVRLTSVGPQSYLVAVVRDITKRKELEQTLVDYKGYLEVVVHDRTQELEAANIRLQREVESRIEAEGELRTRLTRELVLVTMLERFVGAVNQGEAMRQALADLALASGADRACLIAFGPPEEQMTPQPGWCVHPLQEAAPGGAPPASWRSSWLGEAMHLGAPIQIDDAVALAATGDPRGEALVSAGIHALLATPYAANQRPAGFLVLERYQAAQPWAALDRTYVQIAAEILGGARERQRSAEEFRQKDAQYRSLVESANDYIFLLDRDLKLRAVNPVGAAFLRRTQAEALGRSLLELFPPQVAEQHAAAIREVLEDGRVRTVESTSRMGEETVWLLTTLSPVRDTSGAVTGVLGVSRDVTEQRNLERQLRQSQKMDALGRLAGGIAHDFNNLVMIIQASAELLLHELPPEAVARGDASEIVEACERAGSLTRQLLAFSRQEMIEPQRLSVHRVVRDVERMLRRVLGTHIELRIDLEAERSELRAAPGMVDQILLNLAINARDAMPSGGRLEIRTRQVTLTNQRSLPLEHLPQGTYLALDVIDTGEGIPSEALDQVFDPFFTTKGPGRGTGLGLATVYGIVRQLGGDVRITSAQGAGCSVHLLLPVTGAGETHPAPATPTDALPGASRSVLLVEDEEPVRRSVARMLRRRGFVVHEAANGAAALEVAQGLAQPPDLLLSDVVMPQLGGQALARAFQTLYPGTPILLMSGYAAPDDPHLVGADFPLHFLQKPFGERELMSKIDEALRSAGPPTKATVPLPHSS